MKYLFIFWMAVVGVCTLTAQGITGKVLDQDSGEPLIGASVRVLGTAGVHGTITDFEGNFTLSLPDSCLRVQVSYMGYNNLEATACRDAKNELLLAPSGAMLEEVVVVGLGVRHKVRAMASSVFSGNKRHAAPEPKNRESYTTIQENGFIATQKEATSTFGLDVDAASYSNVRRFLFDGQMPPKDAVRSEEMINYFQYAHAAPDGNTP
ncbi:MAG: von Willebrand factor type A domain-containing protein [Saprospiraceae bacterium]